MPHRIRLPSEVRSTTLSSRSDPGPTRRTRSLEHRVRSTPFQNMRLGSHSGHSSGTGTDPTRDSDTATLRPDRRRRCRSNHPIRVLRRRCSQRCCDSFRASCSRPRREGSDLAGHPDTQVEFEPRRLGFHVWRNTQWSAPSAWSMART